MNRIVFIDDEYEDIVITFNEIKRVFKEEDYEIDYYPNNMDDQYDLLNDIDYYFEPNDDDYNEAEARRAINDRLKYNNIILILDHTIKDSNYNGLDIFKKILFELNPKITIIHSGENKKVSDQIDDFINNNREFNIRKARKVHTGMPKKVNLKVQNETGFFGLIESKLLKKNSGIINEPPE